MWKLKEIIKMNETELKSIEALKIDEESAIASYKVAMENLKDKVNDKVMSILEHIMEDEEDHLRKLNKILEGKEEEVEITPAEQERLEQLGY